MSTARAARKLAAAAAFGGGGAGLLGGSLFALLVGQAWWAKRVIGPPRGNPPEVDGRYGDARHGDAEGEPVRLAILGDSTACGLGVWTVDETPGALLAGGLAALADRPVDLRSFAVVGAQSRDLEPQVNSALAVGADVAAIIIGANDVTHVVRPQESVRLLEGAVRRLRENGCEVVVATCPDLGTIQPLRTPLRQCARAWSRRIAAAQTIVAVEAGARSVSLGSLLGPEFAAAPAELFGPDHYHPSAAGYTSAAAALLPSVAASLGFWPADEEPPGATTTSGVLPISFAAVRAAKDSGTEVAATEVGGRTRGPRGRWASLRRHHPTA